MALFPIYELEVPFDDFVKKQLPEIEEDMFYLLAENGLWLVQRSVHSTSIIPAPSVAGLEPAKELVRFHPPKKISAPQFWKILRFFRDVFDQVNKSEAIVIVYWDEAQEAYHFVAPQQEVGPKILAYEVGANPEGMLRLGTIHSHGELTAFHSTVDKKDESHDDGLHITVGELQKFPFVDISCELVVDGKRFTVNPTRIIEYPDLGNEDDQGWLDKVAVWKGGTGMKTLRYVVPAAASPAIQTPGMYPGYQNQATTRPGSPPGQYYGQGYQQGPPAGQQYNIFDDMEDKSPSQVRGGRSGKGNRRGGSRR